MQMLMTMILTPVDCALLCLLMFQLDCQTVCQSCSFRHQNDQKRSPVDVEYVVVEKEEASPLCSWFDQMISTASYWTCVVVLFVDHSSMVLYPLEVWAMYYFDVAAVGIGRYQ